MTDNYLQDLDVEYCNIKGITKTLACRRETISLKHLMKTVFVYWTEEKLQEKLNILNMSIFQYSKYLTNKLRGIYKFPRNMICENTNDLVNQKDGGLNDSIKIWAQLNPIFILDFDGVITVERFQGMYEYLCENFRVIVNSANPNLSKEWFIKHSLPVPGVILANKGLQAKIIALKNIAENHTKDILFQIDDEEKYLEFGALLGMKTFLYQSGFKRFTINIK